MLKFVAGVVYTVAVGFAIVIAYQHMLGDMIANPPFVSGLIGVMVTVGLPQVVALVALVVILATDE